MLDLARTGDLERHPRLAGLGLEPLDAGFDGAALAAALGGRRSPLKIALMDQRLVVGVGNIYACESLFRARLSPLPHGAVACGRRRAGGWRMAIRAVLLEAIGAGGSSLRDYVQANGELGVFQDRFAVYDRAGAPCPACGRPVVKLVQAQSRDLSVQPLPALRGPPARLRPAKSGWTAPAMLLIPGLT